MTRIGILEPAGLVGQELRDQLEERRELWREVLLYSRREGGIGTLTEVGGAVAMVQRVDREELESLDLLFVCDARTEELAFLEPVPERLGAIVIAPMVSVLGGRPVVAGSPDGVRRGELLVSPHPAVVGLAHLLQPLEEHGLEQVVATLLRPASMYDQGALGELFEQTRALLEFKTPFGGERFPHQVAFNVLPGPPDEAAAVVEQLGALLHGAPRIAAHSLQAGVFHGLSLSVFVQLGPSVEVADVTSALAGDERVELAETPESVGPVGAAAGDRVLVGEVRSAPGRPGGFWLWAALDNLTRGGASNAMEIARRLLDGR
ncbi:MAG TPA: Asd/ArgC dimerization domain-containing protein [Thermoanaerobaculia bacterium]|nr:Asd/ArgC dimerization domain-containing protein [Thermoanaerobaculia bacterium]